MKRVEFDKYEKNVTHAEAVKTVASRINYNIENTNESIEYYNNNISNRWEEHKENPDYDPTDDWQMRSWESSLLGEKEVLSLWKKLLGIIDKELSF